MQVYLTEAGALPSSIVPKEDESIALDQLIADLRDTIKPF